jgi:hypothetical protein
MNKIQFAEFETLLDTVAEGYTEQQLQVLFGEMVAEANELEQQNKQDEIYSILKSRTFWILQILLLMFAMTVFLIVKLNG